MAPPSTVVASPQKSAEKRPALKPTIASPMKVRIGTTLAMVTMVLTNAAVWIPRRVIANDPQQDRGSEDRRSGRAALEGGKERSRVANSSTR